MFEDSNTSIKIKEGMETKAAITIHGQKANISKQDNTVQNLHKKKNNKKNKRKALSFTIMMPIVQEKV